MQENARQRVCLIGIGAIGGLHLEAYQRYSTEVQLGIVEIDPQKRSKIEMQGYQTYDSLEDAFTDDYGLYDIALPTFLHFNALDKILSETNASILCEKPLVLNKKELAHLLMKHGDFEKRVNCAFVERFNEPFFMAKQWAKEHSAPFRIHLERRTKKPIQTNWLGKPEQGGDVMLDLGIHDIDAVIWWTGSSLESISRHTLGDDLEEVLINMKDGSEALIVAGWDLPADNEAGIVNIFELQAGEDYFRYDQDREQVVENRKALTVTRRFPIAYFNEIDAMLGKCDELRTHFPTKMELSEAINIVSMIQKDRNA